MAPETLSRVIRATGVVSEINNYTEENTTLRESSERERTQSVFVRSVPLFYKLEIILK